MAKARARCVCTIPGVGRVSVARPSGVARKHTARRHTTGRKRVHHTAAYYYKKQKQYA